MLYMDIYGKIRHKQGRNVDFVFVYEVKNRELQGISLIGYALLKKGYSIGYVNTWHELDRINGEKYRAKVAVLFEAYNTEVIKFALSFIESCDNIINMQWEQILDDSCLEKGSIYLLKDLAKEVYHFSWGQENKNHLVNRCDIPIEKIKMVGHVGLDFLREEFDKFYKSRESICKQYNISFNKRIVIFLSSFLSMEYEASGSEEFDKIRYCSQIKIIDWMKKYVEKHTDTVFIYRPHPTEYITKKLKKLCGEEIKIIKDYSVQQWITIADCVLNWNSTSMIDIYVAKKPCLLLRPYPIIPRFEYYYFRNAKKIVSYEEFEKKMMSNYDFPIPQNDILNCYYLDENEYCYEKIVNELEQIYKINSDMIFPIKKNQEINENRRVRNLRLEFGYYKIKLLNWLSNGKYEQNYFDLHYHRVMDFENYVSEKKIIKIMKRIKTCIE